MVTVYFDGLCPLCSREIDHYRRHTKSVRFVDITDDAFHAETEGLDPKAVHRHLHAKDTAGVVHTGVDAFIALWSAIPRYQWAARLASWPLVHGILRLAYALFAIARPWLPRRRRPCDTGRCDIS